MSVIDYGLYHKLPTRRRRKKQRNDGNANANANAEMRQRCEANRDSRQTELRAKFCETKKLLETTQEDKEKKNGQSIKECGRAQHSTASVYIAQHILPMQGDLTLSSRSM